MDINRCLLLAFFTTIFALKAKPQDEITGIPLCNYPFVNTEANKIVLIDTTAWQYFFNELEQVSTQGNGKVSIVHIGDSHLQADYFSGAVRKKLQTYFLGSVGGRGFIFPYRIAQTNNPTNYRVHWRGSWDNCRAVQHNLKCKLGLSGIAITTTDTNARIDIGISDPTLPYYDFDHLMVFHEIGPQSFTPVVVYPQKSCKIFTDSLKGFTLFQFDENVDSVSIIFKQTYASQTFFTLYGLNFDSSDPGIIYHTIGINGACIESYLKCDYFVPHLSALNPNLVIVSLGTNDSYSVQFDSLLFETQITQITTLIRQAAPQCAILFTTPGDNLYHRRMINPNTQKAASSIKKMAYADGFSVWDFNAIMGQPGCVYQWQKAGLGHTDYLHFTRKGYEYQADLFFTAFMELFGQYADSQPKQINTP